MQLESSLRDRLWAATDWGHCLRQLASEVKTQTASTAAARQALVLARAMEAIVPERIHAVEMYLTAWQMAGTSLEALARARSLARELGDLPLSAKIARLEFKSTGRGHLLVVEGLAWLDAGDANRALRPLLEASRQRPDDPAIRLALMTARREWPNVREVVARLEDQGQGALDPELGCQSYLQAARIVRMLDPKSDHYGRFLLGAFSRLPSDESAFCLVEQHLRERGERERLLAVYGARAKSATDDAAMVEVYRRAASALFLQSGELGLGVRIARKALEHAYRRKLSPIPGHLALFELLRRHLQQTGNLPGFLPLLEQGHAHACDEQERLWFSLQGLQLAWGQLRDGSAADRYATEVRARVPGHELLADFEGPQASSPQGEDQAWQVEGLSMVYLDSVRRESEPVPSADRPIGLAAASGEWVVDQSSPSTPAKAPMNREDAPERAGSDGALELGGPPPPSAPPPEEAAVAEVEVQAAAPEPPPSTPPPPEEAAVAEPPAPVGESADQELGGFVELASDIMEGVLELESDEDENATTQVFEAASPEMVAATGQHASSTREEHAGGGPPTESDSKGAAVGEEDLPLDHEPGTALVAEPVGESAPESTAPPVSLIPRAALEALEASKPERAKRFASTADLVLRLADGSEVSGVVRDMSTSGLFVALREELTLNVSYACTLQLPGANEWSVEEHAVRLLVVREVEGVGYGGAFVDPAKDLLRAIERLSSAGTAPGD